MTIKYKIKHLIIKMLSYSAFLFNIYDKLRNAQKVYFIRRRLGSCGDNVYFNSDSVFWSAETIFLGRDVHIGYGALLSAVNTFISIGNKVFFGPQVSIIAGNHNIGVVGSYMYDVEVKRKYDDLPVIIEDDVWIGFRAIILKGVRIGRGSVVAAGAVVTHDVPRYSIVAGVPAKVIKMRFSPVEIQEHERLLSYHFNRKELNDQDCI